MAIKTIVGNNWRKCAPSKNRANKGKRFQKKKEKWQEIGREKNKSKEGQEQKAKRETSKEETELEQELEGKTGREEVEPEWEAEKKTSKKEIGPEWETKGETSGKKAGPERKAEGKTSENKTGPGVERKVGPKAERETRAPLRTLSWFSFGFLLSITSWRFFAYFFMRFCFYFSFLDCLATDFRSSKSTFSIRLFLLLAV